MDVTDAVFLRHSVRAFTNRPVDRDTIVSILDKARWSPSGGNLQPWRVFVLGGSRLSELVSMIETKLSQNPTGEGAEYDIYPPNLKEPYRTHRFECGEKLYKSIGIERADKQARLRQFAENYRFFGAPVGLLFFIDREMGVGQWSDVGMFIQTFMLLAKEQGLDTCAQESWAYWSPTVSDYLGAPSNLMLFCGMALGYKDERHPINQWRTDRQALDDFVDWYGI